VRLKGLNQITKKRADGSRVTYWYAWKGGPRLPGSPGSPEFMAAYNEAVAERRAPKTDTLRSLAILYKQSPEFAALGETTKREWTRWLDVIMDEGGSLSIGGLPFDALDDRRVKAEILAWRDQWADRPRKADYGIQVLSRVLSWGMDRGLLALNAAARSSSSTRAIEPIRYGRPKRSRDTPPRPNPPRSDSSSGLLA